MKFNEDELIFWIMICLTAMVVFAIAATIVWRSV